MGGLPRGPLAAAWFPLCLRGLGDSPKVSESQAWVGLAEQFPWAVCEAHSTFPKPSTLAIAAMRWSMESKGAPPHLQIYCWWVGCSPGWVSQCASLQHRSKPCCPQWHVLALSGMTASPAMVQCWFHLALQYDLPGSWWPAGEACRWRLGSPKSK